MRRIVLRAPAKLNLHLGIYSQLDSRGYHKADSLMVALDLCDEVAVWEPGAEERTGEPQVVCTPPVGIPAQKNTAYRAVMELAQRVDKNPDVHVSITKQVPDQSGMGGSSSDAAAVLRALCELWDVDADDPRVFQAARSVGADVPFFLDPVPTLLVGAGDEVGQKFPPLSAPVPVALVRPAGPGVSTPAAYAEFDRQPSAPADPAALCELLREGAAEPGQIAALLSNNLDPVACRLLPQVEAVRTWLLARPGVLGGQVTGSGSCVFALCATDACAQAVVADARAQLDVWACATHMR